MFCAGKTIGLPILPFGTGAAMPLGVSALTQLACVPINDNGYMAAGSTSAAGSNSLTSAATTSGAFQRQSILTRPENAKTLDVTELQHLQQETIHSFGVTAMKAALPKGTKIEDVEKEIQKEYGECVDRAQIPELYKSCDQIMDRLASAFETLNSSGIAITHKFFIVDSDKENACVFPLIGRSRSKRTNLVYVTTGLLRKLLSENGEFTPETMNRGLLRLAGILSHELAHPLDRLDSEGLHKRWGSSQAQEVRADIESILMLRKAGLPTRSPLDALETILDRSKQGVISAGIDTHHEDDLRLSTIKLMLTLDDFERGEATVRDLKGVDEAAMISEFNKIEPKKAVEKPASEPEKEFIKPQTLLEEIERIVVEKTYNDKVADDFDKIKDVPLSEISRKYIEEMFTTSINMMGNDISLDDILQIKDPYPIFKHISAHAKRDIMAKAIYKSRHSTDVKRKLLWDLFVHHDYLNWMDCINDEKSESANFYNILLQEGIIKSTSDLLLKIVVAVRPYMTTSEDDIEFSTGYPGYRDCSEEEFAALVCRDNVDKYYTNYLPFWASKLIEELKTIECITDPAIRKKRLFEFFEVLNPFAWAEPYRKTIESIEYEDWASGDTLTMRQIKSAMVDVANTLELDHEGELEFFMRLTETGRSPAADEYFAAHLEPILTQKPYGRKIIENILSHKTPFGRCSSIFSPMLQARLARFVVEPEFTPEVDRSEKALKKLIKKIEILAPKPSIHRDALFEDVAWRCDVRQDLVHHIENAKSTNWRNGSPLRVNALSAGSAWINRFNREQRISAIEYVMNPRGRPLPDTLADEVKKSLKKEKYMDPDLGLGVMEIAQMINEATPEERVPLILLLLEKGKPSLMQETDFSDAIVHKLLGYAHGSNEEKVLLAALKSIPPEHDYQKPVVLAYLLSISNEEKRGIRAIFEAFTAVGIKLGQRASLFWDNVSQDVRDQLAELKDNARSLSKAEIYKIMQETLLPTEFARIKRLKKILGSASLRTAVLVELTDGREAVMLVQRPHAREQIESNVKRARRLLPELEKEGFSAYVKIINAFLDPVGEQLTRELKMTREALVLDKARAFYEDVNQQRLVQLSGWRFVVPGLTKGFSVHDNLMFIDKVTGVPFDDIPKGKAKQIAGRHIVSAALSSLFHHGLMNTDPHSGNYLIDPEQKTIGVIDWGEVEEYSVNRSAVSADDPYYLTQFLMGIATGDAAKILHYGWRMNGHARQKDETHAKKRIETAITEGKDFAARLIGVVNALFESDRALARRFSAGAIVGLMILAREGYVDDQTFKLLLGFEAARVVAGKLPRVAASAVYRRIDESLKHYFGMSLPF